MHEPRHLPTRSQFVAVVSGNALEFYDFLSFGFFAVNLSRVMFPADVPGTALLVTLMTAGAGFAARPLGAILFGLLGDRIGRRPTMLATFALMGASALGLALTPEYATIGMAAPIMVVVFRLLQGLAAGGDVGPTTAFLAESAPPERRGLMIGLQIVAMRLGVVASGVVGLVLAALLTPAQLDAFGWRIAFALGAGIVPLAFILRRRLDETLHLPETGPHVVTEVHPATYAAALLGVAGFLLGGAAGDYLYVFVVTFLKFSPTQGYALQLSSAATQALCAVAAGWLGDRFGRRPVILVGAISGAFLILPVFRWGLAGGTLGSLIAAVVAIQIMACLCAAPAYAAFVETTPKRHRAGLVGIGYGIIVALAFSLTPVILTRYLNGGGDLAAPAYAYVLGAVLLTVSALLVPETAARRIARTGAEPVRQGA